MAQGIASKPFDRALEFNLTPQTRGLLRADASDSVYYQVLNQRGELVSGDNALRLPAHNAAPDPSMHGGERGRVMQPLYQSLGANVDGSGLELAIVQEIAQ